MKTLNLLKRMNKHLMRMGAVSLVFVLFTEKVFAQANFSLFPATTQVNNAETFTIEVRVDLNQSNNTQLDVAEAYLNFDPAYLQVVGQPTNSSALGSVALNAANNTTGTVDFAAGSPTPVTTDFTLVTITFQAIATPPGGTTSISFNTQLPRKTDAFRSGSTILGTLSPPAVITINVNPSLPVTFIDFSAGSQENNVILKWTTGTEINNKGFEIQRSHDQTGWTVLGFVNSVGNTGEEKKYNYTDSKLEPGRYYYRLKQQDHNGKFQYSNVVSIKLGGSKFFELGQNQPNPFSGKTSISFTLAEKRKVTLTLFDSQGRLIKTLLNATKDEGNHIIDLNFQTLKSGIYYYKLVAGDFTDVKNFIVR
jgi:hypothetical protein